MPKKSRSHNNIPETGTVKSPDIPKISGKRSVVGHIKIDPRVWKTALRLAEGNAYRIRVWNAECVTVYNSEEMRKNAG